MSTAFHLTHWDAEQKVFNFDYRCKSCFVCFVVAVVVAAVMPCVAVVAVT